MHEIGIEGRELAILMQQVKQGRPHLDDSGRSARRHVQTANDLLPARLRRAMHGLGRHVGRIFLIRRNGSGELSAVDTEAGAHGVQKIATLAFIEGCPVRPNSFCHGEAGGLSATGEQGFKEWAEIGVW